jgi:hypothetical protein
MQVSDGSHQPRGKLRWLAVNLAWILSIVIGGLVVLSSLARWLFFAVIGSLGTPNGPPPIPPMELFWFGLSLGWMAFGAALFTAIRLRAASRRLGSTALGQWSKWLVALTTMLAVADIVATIPMLRLQGRSIALKRLADWHYAESARYSSKADPNLLGNARADALCNYHRGLGDKYGYAANEPWMSVEPDPPPP